MPDVGAGVAFAQEQRLAPILSFRPARWLHARQRRCPRGRVLLRLGRMTAEGGAIKPSLEVELARGDPHGVARLAYGLLLVRVEAAVGAADDDSDLDRARAPDPACP